MIARLNRPGVPTDSSELNARPHANHVTRRRPPADAPRGWFAYSIAVGLTFLAFALRMLFGPALAGIQPFAFFYLSVALSAWWIGAGPAAVAGALGMVMGTCFFLPPTFAFSIPSLVPIGIYSLVTICIILVIRYARNAEGLALESARRSREAESALRESEESFEQAFAHAPVGMAVTDLDTHLHQVNRALCELTGYDDHDLLNSAITLKQLTHPADVPVAQDALRRLIAGEIPSYFVEKRLVRKDGEIVWVRLSASLRRRPDGRPFQIIALLENIHERKLTEASLRDSEERFRAVADNIPQLAWMTSADGRMLWFNRRWIEYTGKSLEAMQRDGWGAVHHPDHPRDVVAGWQRALTTGEPWEDTFPLRSRDGQYRWFLSRAFPIRDSAGRIESWFGTNTDISNLKETEQALADARNEMARHAQQLEKTVEERTAKLRETVGELEAFSYSLSHDMRAPLRAMKGFSQILEVDYGDRIGEEGRIYLGKISRAAGRLDQLIRDVLTYSRILREQITLKPTEVGRLVRQLIDENPALQPPQTEITIDAPHPVLGHEAYLMQVLSNLVYNAVKFVAPGQRPNVRIWTEESDAHVSIFVRDNGIGIPKAAQERMFGMFQRLHSDQSYEGTGIGLAIVRKAVERMGGTVSVESETGKGSTFRVQLQRAHAPVANSED